MGEPFCASSAFHVCGRFTVRHDRSSKPGAWAPGTSPRWNLQCDDNGTVSRADAADGTARAISATATATSRSGTPLHRRQRGASWGDHHPIRPTEPPTVLACRASLWWVPCLPMLASLVGPRRLVARMMVEDGTNLP